MFFKIILYSIFKLECIYTCDYYLSFHLIKVLTNWNIESKAYPFFFHLNVLKCDQHDAFL